MNKEKLDAIWFILEHGKNYISPAEIKRLQLLGCWIADDILGDVQVKFCDAAARPS